MIESSTGYPFENTFQYHVKTSKPATFAIKIRQPAWCRKIVCDEPYTLENGFIVITKHWKDDHFTLTFEATPSTKQDLKGEYFFSYGALVLAHPLEAREEITKEYPIAGLEELKYLPLSKTIYQYNPGTALKQKDGLKFFAEMFNPASQQNEWITLQPMANTILRQVTFKLK